jgi:hypothetical protein
MFEVKVTIEAPGLSDAVNNLAQALTASTRTQVTLDVAKPDAEKPDAVAAAPIPAPCAEAASEATIQPEIPTQPAEPGAQTQEAATQAMPASPAPVEQVPVKKVTVDELARAGAALVDQGKMNDLMGLLQNFGVAAITHLRDDQLSNFADGMRKLGAKI